MAQISGVSLLGIVKGLPKVPGDTTSLESMDSLNLLDTQGFSATEYNMQVPALKGSTVHADSPLTDGRTLISGSLGNVTETIRLELVAGTIMQLAAMLTRLMRFRQDCLNFWQTFNQFQPVYLQHQIIGEPGPRYALLYDIEIHIDTPTLPSIPERTVTLTIEREYGWRGIPPGANPRFWSIYFRGAAKDWNTTAVNLALASTTHDQFTNLNVFNHIQFSANAATIDKANFLDIPGASIPGDLPALTIIDFDPDDSIGKVYVSRDTLNKTNTNLAAIHTHQKYDLAAAWATLGTDTTSVADTGGISYNGGAAARGQISFATVATDTMRLEWSLIWAHTHTRFAAFARMRQNGGALGDIKTSLKVFGSNTSVFITTTEVSPTLQAGAGNTTDWPVTYMGVLQIPISDLYSDSAGKGLSQTLASSVDFMARRTTGAGVLYVADIVLVPISEAAMCMINGANASTDLLLDTTNYLSHGRIGLPTPMSEPELELRGQPITLIPGIDNRLYFFTTTVTDTSQVGYTADVAVNIVPRWSGLRDR